MARVSSCYSPAGQVTESGGILQPSLSQTPSFLGPVSADLVVALVLIQPLGGFDLGGQAWGLMCRTLGASPSHRPKRVFDGRTFKRPQGRPWGRTGAGEE